MRLVRAGGAIGGAAVTLTQPVRRGAPKLRPMTDYHRHPDLADDFVWQRRSQYEQPDTALTLHNVVVVQMLDRIDGGWVARLHLEDGIEAPLILRQCTDFNSGRHGAERWVLRHEAELRANVARKVAWMRREVAQGKRL